MPRTPKTPQDKKRLSLKKDRRNTYGENAKSSRKNIKRNKANAHRETRHAARIAANKLDRVPEDVAEVLESTMKTPRLQKGRWKKSPDTPLGLVVKGKLETRKATVGRKKRRRALRS